MYNIKKIFTIVTILSLAFVNYACGIYREGETTRIVSPEGNAYTGQTGDEPSSISTNTTPESHKKDETMSTESPETEPGPVREPARITFVAAGDNVIHPCIYMDAKNRATSETREYNFKPMYEDVVDYIASFDLAFINQETLMGGADLGYSGYPCFNSPQDLGLDLIDIGFDIVNIANNHMCDKGQKGLKGAIDFWKSQTDVTMIGGYSDETDYNTLRIVERNGVKIGLLSYTYGTNGISLPASSELVVPYINDEDIIRQCAQAKEQSDFLIISVHWGNENQTQVSAEQKRVAKLMAENGADVIIGHHPHVLQSIEVIESDYGETLCVYSLGNFVSAMQYWQNMVGGFFSFDIVADENGNVSFENAAFVPTAFYYGPSYFNSHLYFLRVYPAEKAATHGTKNLYNNTATPDQMRDYAKKIMGDYLKDYEPASDDESLRQSDE